MSAGQESTPREAKAALEARVRAKALARADARTAKSLKAKTRKRPPKKRKSAAGGRKTETKPPRQVQTGRGNLWILMLLTFVGVVAAAIEFPTFIILACGMPPALVAALIDDKPGRHASICVSAASLAGMVPVLISLWMGDNSIVMAMRLLSDVYVWFGMYGTTAVGWMLVWACPVASEIGLAISATYHTNKLRSYQKQLIEEWGDVVAS
jgi:hypothetical protein